MKKIINVFLFIVPAILINAQNDPQAKAILDQVSAKNKAYKTVNASFTISESSTQNGQKSTKNGTFLLKGDKYAIKLPDSEIYFDGKDVYNYLPASNEVNVSKPQTSAKNGDDFFISNPKDIFRIYQKDFKYKFIRETTAGGKAIYEVDLYPNDLKKKYNRIRMEIDKNTYQILSIKAFFKDGYQYSVTFDKYEVNKDVSDSSFVFDKTKHPNAEVIDLRF